MCLRDNTAINNVHKAKLYEITDMSYMQVSANTTYEHTGTQIHTCKQIYPRAEPRPCQLKVLVPPQHSWGSPTSSLACPSKPAMGTGTMLALQGRASYKFWGLGTRCSSAAIPEKGLAT